VNPFHRTNCRRAKASAYFGENFLPLSESGLPDDIFSSSLRIRIARIYIFKLNFLGKFWSAEVAKLFCFVEYILRPMGTFYGPLVI
jgi:hypothetical protein